MQHADILPHELIIEQKIAQGGASTLWRVRHESQADPFVLKYAHYARDDNPYVDEQFANEWLVSCILRGRFSVPLYEFAYDAKHHAYLYMPLVQALTLRKDRNRVTHWDGLKLRFNALAKSLMGVHTLGVVHRDLKPSNVFILHTGEAVLLDFGLALTEHSDFGLLESQALGTPLYIAPEQAMGHVKRFGPPIDAYAMGVMLYEYVFGDHPFKGKDDTETMEMHCFHPLDTGRTPLFPIPNKAKDLIFSLLEKDADQRATPKDWLHWQHS